MCYHPALPFCHAWMLYLALMTRGTPVPPPPHRLVTMADCKRCLPTLITNSFHYRLSAGGLASTFMATSFRVISRTRRLMLESCIRQSVSVTTPGLNHVQNILYRNTIQRNHSSCESKCAVSCESLATAVVTHDKVVYSMSTCSFSSLTA